jgi:hypothetical protein
MVPFSSATFRWPAVAACAGAMALKMTLAEGGFSRFPAEVLLIISRQRTSIG